MMVYTCNDLRAIGLNHSCCPSCHSDAEEYGYPLLDQENGDDILYYCCGFAEAMVNIDEIWVKLRALNKEEVNEN